MKIATQCALAGGLLLAGIAHACANPVEIEGCESTAPGARDCDVILAQPSEFGADASVPAQGGSAGNGSNPQPGGGAGSSNAPPLGGNAGSGSAGTGSAFNGTAGSGSVIGGSAGSSSGGQGGAAGSGSAGTGGAGSGSAGTGSAGTGSAGTGSAGTGSQSNFELGACDLQNRTGCEEFACETACPAGGAGNYCRTNCPLIVNCVAAAPDCISEADPMCGTPSQNPFTENECTSEVNSSQNPATAGTPSNVALALIRCLCSDPRP